MTAPHAGIDLLASAPQYRDHVAPAHEPGPGPIVAVAFHWAGAMLELRWAWPHFRVAIVRLAARYTVIGRVHRKLTRFWAFGRASEGSGVAPLTAELGAPR